MLLLNRGTGRPAPAWRSGGARKTLSQPVGSIAGAPYLRLVTAATFPLEHAGGRADSSGGAAVTYDETWDDVPARRFPLAAIAVVLALGALATAMYVVVRQSTITSAERTARQDEVGKLEQRVAALESRNAALSGRLGSAEKSLKQKDGGIAPLAKRVLKSVFTVQTDSGLGTGFVAWRDSTGTFIVTANHVVADQL